MNVVLLGSTLNGLEFCFLQPAKTNAVIELNKFFPNATHLYGTMSKKVVSFMIKQVRQTRREVS